ncbi:MAG: hypothetical protein WC292_06210 [Clostridia bacterium]
MRYRRDITPRLSRYQYKISNFKGVDAETEESALEPSVATYACNVGFSDGKLVGGMGLGEPLLYTTEYGDRYLPSLDSYSASMKKLFLYRKKNAAGENDDRVIALGGDLTVYQCAIRNGLFTKINGLEVSGNDANFLNYYYNDKDVLIVAGNGGGLVIYDGSTIQTVSEAPAMHSICMHYERMYGVDKENVYFSEALNPAGWDVSSGGAGHISFMNEGGAIIKILSFKDYIFIFREYAVYRLSAYTEPSEFRVTKAFDTGGKIQAGSIVVAGNDIIFLAGHDLYSFDGYSITRMFSKVTALIDIPDKAAAIYYKDKYYLSVRLKSYKDEKIGDEVLGPYTNNGFLMFDMKTGGISVFRGGDIRGFCPIVSEGIDALVVNFNNYRMARAGGINDSGTLFGEPLKKLWIGAKSNFGSVDAYKVLKRLYIATRYGISVEAESNLDVAQKTVSGGLKPQLVTFNLIGDTIRLILETQNNKIHISNILLELDFSRRYYAN